MKEVSSLLRWLLAYPVGLLAGGCAAGAVYLAFSIPAAFGVLFMKVVGLILACLLGALTFVTVAAGVAPAARVAAALAAGGLVLLTAASVWDRLPSAAAWPLVLPLLLGAAGGVMEVHRGERERARRAAAGPEAGQPPGSTPPQA